MKHSLICVFLLAICVHAQDAPQPTKPKAGSTQWEYTILTSNHADNEKEELAKLGAQGWELISVIYVDALSGKEPFSKRPTHLRYYFKRQKPS